MVNFVPVDTQIVDKLVKGDVQVRETVALT